MASQYEYTKTEIVRNITAQKTIYKFRVFMYSLNKDIRQNCFRISRDFLENEYNNNSTLTVTERERLQLLLNHWQWISFDNDSTAWWSRLTVNHYTSLSLMTTIHLWTDDINTFDPEVFETSTDGLR